MAGNLKRIAVVSALPAVRAGLRALVEADGAYTVVAEVSRPSLLSQPGADALPVVDAIILDAEPGADARDVAAAAVGASLAAVVILGALDGDERLPVLLGRPFALLPRDASGEQLRAALDAVANGLIAVDPLSAERLFTPLATAPAAGANPDRANPDHLTAREREVLQLVAEGLPNKTIARRLAISDHTVKFHVAAVMAKLNASSRTEAVHQGARRGLITL